MAQRIRKGLTLLILFALAALLTALFKPITPTVAPIQPRASTQYWEMAGGYRIAYTVIESNQPEAIPVIYLHGGPGGYIHSSIIETLRGLADDGFDVYLYDQSGTGLSDRRSPPKVTSFAAHVADLKEIVAEQIGAKQVHVIGHSAGGLIAAHFASANPDRVARLVLSAPAIIEPMQFTDDGRWLNEQRFATPAALNFIDVADGYAEATGIGQLPLRAIASIAIAQLFNVRFAPDIEVDAALNTMASGFTRYMVCYPDKVQPEEGGGGAYSRTGANFFPDDFDDHRDKMRVAPMPVLVLHGQCDFLPYAGMAEYVDLFPNARYQFLPAAGHVLWWDQPAAYLRTIRTFLVADREQNR